MKSVVRPSSSGNEPRSGTPKPNTVTAVATIIWNTPITANGQQLAHEQLPRADRRDDELLHGADLLLAHDPHGREQHRHDHQDHREHGRHVEPAALEVGVVEDPRDEHDLADGGASAAPVAAQPPLLDRDAELARDGRGVAEGDVGRGRRRCRPRSAGRAAGRDAASAAPKPWPITRPSCASRGHEPAVDLGGPLAAADDLEVARLDEAVDELAARRAAVLVDEHRRHVGHVGVDGEAEDRDLDDRARRR